MTISIIKAQFKNNINEVWNIVTDIKNCTWRSDIKSTEILSNGTFIEYDHNDFPTTFTITKIEPNKCWEFDIENDTLSGHWTGNFYSKGNETEIEFIEDIKVKKFYLFPFVKTYLKKQQRQYIQDLKNRLNS